LSFSTENPEPDESLLLFMSQNKGEEVKETMRLTVFQRRSLIRANGSFEALEKLLRDRMPRLLDVEGMVMIINNILTCIVRHFIHFFNDPLFLKRFLKIFKYDTQILL
jgi:hypothetical protein